MSLHGRDVEQDVHVLSTLLGDVLADQTSSDALETVERVRTSAIAYRREGAEPRSAVRAELDGLEPENLDRRNPYVDPLNLLQVRLLATENRTDAEERALRLTVKGIAAGMKSTG